MKKLIVVICVLVIGCGTIMHGTRQDIGITSTPTGAMVSIDNVSYGKTPMIVDLKRRDNHIIKINLPGYMPHESVVIKSISGWVWGNVLFGGLVGLAVDAISGGIYKLSPEQITSILNKEEIGANIKTDTMYIAIIMTPNPAWEKVGELQKR